MDMVLPAFPQRPHPGDLLLLDRRADRGSSDGDIVLNACSDVINNLVTAASFSLMTTP